MFVAQRKQLVQEPSVLPILASHAGFSFNAYLVRHGIAIRAEETVKIVGMNNDA